MKIGPTAEWIPRSEMGDRKYRQLMDRFWDTILSLCETYPGTPEFSRAATRQLMGLKHPGAGTG